MIRRGAEREREKSKGCIVNAYPVRKKTICRRDNTNAKKQITKRIVLININMTKIAAGKKHKNKPLVKRKYCIILSNVVEQI